MRRQLYIYLLSIAVILQSCKTNQPTMSAVHPPPAKSSNNELSFYRASNTVLHDLVNTSLKVRFDWSKRYLFGKAEITLHPHFYASNSLVLNARGMQINEVSLLKPSGKTPLVYQYSKDSLFITLDQRYNREENYTVYIDYIAKPEELDSIGGSEAIASDKGLYFINADGKDKYKPREIWTQGETQSNSVWFPTIDAPNQKMTQDISITTDSTMVTLSNGLLLKSVFNGDGTRTDLWKQSLPHAPYLAMMAIGKYAVVKDSWKGREVSYYVEPEFKNAARKIFGNTPEMMEFFSNKLQFPYAWEKYAQVIARDYVSGSMENSSATLHGEFLQQDERELLDKSGEEFISHELFHQWFGDLVTCESWSNIPLNESFATYGEYLWNEHKYGKEAADYGFQNDLASYLREARYKQVNIFRYYYESQEELFDRHSYEKGGCVLHMLRKYIGDEAFFASLKLYLEKNKFKSVEIHNLRLAFEEVTGEDLNWFFNQWFLSSGHPDLDISYQWNETAKEETVTIKQLQNVEKFPLFKLPVDVDIYINKTVRRQRIICNKTEQAFSFSCNTKPDVINVDAEKMLLCTKKDNHTMEEWIYLYKNGKSYTDRKEALQFLSKDCKAGTTGATIMLAALDDPFWSLRKFTINNLEPLVGSSDRELIKSKFLTLIKNDPVANVRNAALKALVKYFPDDDHSSVLRIAINDSSYSVSGEALAVFTKKDTVEGLAIAAKMEDVTKKSLRESLTNLYSEYGSDEQAAFMGEAMLRATGYDRYHVVDAYGQFLKRCNNTTILKQGLVYIDDQARNDIMWLNRRAAIQTLKELQNYFQGKSSNTQYIELKEKTDQYLNDIKLNEKDARMKKVLGNN